MHASVYRTEKPYQLIRAGVLFGGFYWVFESIRNVMIGKGSDIFERIFIPGPMEFWMRILVVCILLLFAVISYKLHHKLNDRNASPEDVPGSREVTAMCLGFGLLYWLLESLRDVVVFNRGGFLERVFMPDSMSVWMRILPILIVVLFGVYFHGLLEERKKLLQRQLEGEKALSEKDREFVALKEYINVGIFKVTRRGHFVEVNNAFAAMFGYRHKQDILSLHTSDLFNEPENRLDLDRRMTEDGEVSEAEYLMKRRNGAPVWISVSAVAVCDNSGATLYYEGIIENITRRKEMALEIERRKLYLESVLAHAPAGIVTLDKNHKVVDWNTGAEKIFGYCADQALGKDIDSLISGKEGMDECRALAERVLRGEVLAPVEATRYRKDGTKVQVLCSGSPIYINNELHGIVAVYEDISKIVNTEKALKSSEEKYRLITESTSDVIWSFNLDGTTIYASPSVTQLLGFTPQESLHLESKDIISAEDFQTAKQVLAEELALEKHKNAHVRRSRTVDVRLIRKDGSMVWTETKATFIRSDEGEPVGILMVFRDISPRRKADHELKRLNRALKTLSAGNKALVRASNEKVLFQDVCEILVKIGGYAFAWAGLAVRDEHLSVKPVAMAAAAESWRGCGTGIDTLADTLGRKGLASVRAAETRIETNANSKMSRIVLPLHNNSLVLGVLCIYSKSDPAFDKEEISLLEEMAGDLAFGISVLHTRTVQKTMEKERDAIQQQLLQAQKMEAIGVLTGGIAHDFNNLLTAIIGCSDMALMDVAEDNPVYRELQDIQSAANRAADLTGQLLLFSRKQAMKFESVNIDAVINDLKKLLVRLLDENVRIETVLPKELWPVCADKGTIEQVIMNLSVNARDAMPEGGIIGIEAENNVINAEQARINPEARPGKYVRLRISDTGTGMTEQVRQQIFDPFFSTKGKSKGTGLGLSVVYGIIKQHEGWIQVNTEKGKGTEFVIYLPVLEKKITRKKESRRVPQGFNGEGRRILVVEDEEKVREFTINGLGRSGYTVYAAATAVEAKELFDRESGDFDLVISDVGLPGQSGIDLVNELVRKKPGLKILLSSGYSDHTARWPLIKKKGYKFLEKPYALNDLLFEISSMNA